MMRRARAQRGNVLLVVLVLAALVVGAWQFSAYKDRARARAEAAAAAAAAQAQETAARARAAEAREREDRERQALEARIEKKRADLDALKKSLAAMDALVARWQDALRVADSTARVSLAGPVAELQKIRRDAAPLTVPPCLDSGKAALLSAMDLSVNGFITFMQNKYDAGSAIAQPYFDGAAQSTQRYTAARAGCAGAADIGGTGGEQ